MKSSLFSFVYIAFLISKYQLPLYKDHLDTHHPFPKILMRYLFSIKLLKGCNMLKKYIAASLIFLSLPIQAKELTTYQAIKETLTQGNLITMVISANDCTIKNPNPIPISVDQAVFKPQTILLNDKGYLAASGSWFVSSLPSNTGNGVNQYYKVILNNLDQAKITWEFFNADTGQKNAMQTIEATCELRKGIKVYQN